jgi:GT2 family glycosyltransferase
MKSKIGIAMPCFNNLIVVKKSLPAVYSDDFLIVLFDDGSEDGTKEWVLNNFPNVRVLTGSGENWWGGSLKKAIDVCMAEGCDYIVSLNADVIISPEIVLRLTDVSKSNSNAIVASLVVDVNNPEQILWSGSVFGKIHKFIPIYSSRYLVKAGNTVDKLAKVPYEVDEVHGRGVIIPNNVLKKIGNYDSTTFPQYGGDTDFSFRAKSNNIKMLVDPLCIAKVFVENTSLNKREILSFRKKLFSIKQYLFVRKNGEALYVWWRLYRKHLPLRYLLQSFIFVILLNVYRKIIQ